MTKHTPESVEEVVAEFRKVYVKVEEVIDRNVLDKYEDWLRTTLTHLITTACKPYKDELKDVKQAHKELVELIKKERKDHTAAITTAEARGAERVRDIAYNFNPHATYKGQAVYDAVESYLQTHTP